MSGNVRRWFTEPPPLLLPLALVLLCVALVRRLTLRPGISDGLRQGCSGLALQASAVSLAPWLMPSTRACR